MKALDALLNYQQADTDGLMVLVSRQAVHEVADAINQMRGMAREGCTAQNAAYRWCERIDQVGFDGPQAEYEDYSRSQKE